MIRSTRRSRRRLVLAAVAIASAAGAYGAFRHYLLPGLVLLHGLEATDPPEEPPPPSWTQEEVHVPGPAGPMRVRVLRPAEPRARLLVLVHGVQADGIDGERMTRFSRRLVELGHPVVIPEIRDLQEIELEARSVDEIEAAVRWAFDLAGGSRVGLLGASIGGGFAVAAAGRPSIRDRIALVVSLGGHADLTSLVDYLLSGRLEDGSTREPHAYAVETLAHAFAERLVPPEQVRPFKACLLATLRDEDATAQELASRLPSPAAELARLAIERRGGELGRAIAPALEGLSFDPGMSPLTAPVPSCPVFLLHGTHDDLIPASHAVRLHDRLARTTDCSLLVTPLVGHADFTGEDWWELIQVAAFLTAILRV